MIQGVLKAAAAAFATVPGIAVLTSGVWVPPGQQVVFGIVLEVLGIAILLVLFANQGRIQRWTRSRVTWTSLLLLSAAFGLVVSYQLLFDHCVARSTQPEWRSVAVYFPLWLEGEVATAVERQGSRTALLDRYGPGEVERQLSKMTGIAGASSCTTAILVVNYGAMIMALSALFGILGLCQPRQAKGPVRT